MQSHWEFLESFYVKDAENFEKWMMVVRNENRDIYIRKLYIEIEKLIENKD